MNILIIISNTFRSQYNEIFKTLNPNDTVTIISLINKVHLKNMSDKRKYFLYKTVKQFRDDLSRKNIFVQEYIGETQLLFNKILEENIFDKILIEKGYAYDEIKFEEYVKSYCEKKEITCSIVETQTLVNIDELPFPLEQIPNTYTSFRNKVETNNCYDITLPNKELPKFISNSKEKHVSLSDFNVKEQELIVRPTREEALNHLKKYIWEKEYVKTYKETRNQMIGDNFSTKFSFYLHYGILSVKEIINEINIYEREVLENKSTYWVKFELLWREYCKFSGLKYGSKVFTKTGIKEKIIYSKFNQELYDSFIQGKTGYPLVDAGVRELISTGFMSNRARQNVASFFIKNLHLPWLLGAQFFEEHLLDYDPCSNYLNWQYIAGCGTDGREFRYFNISKQTKDYDPKFEYISFWVPEYKSPNYVKPIVNFFDSIEIAKKNS